MSQFKILSLSEPNFVFRPPFRIKDGPILNNGSICSVQKVWIDGRAFARRILKKSCKPFILAMEKNGAIAHYSLSNSPDPLAKEVILKLYWYQNYDKKIEQILELIPSIKGLEFPDLYSALNVSSTDDTYDIRHNKKNQFDCILSCLKMLKVLHDRNIFHLDIKPENIAVMVDNNNKLKFKLFDFGFSVSEKVYSDDTNSSYHFSGSHRFLNPYAKTGFEKDHFAMAITILEIAGLASLVEKICLECEEDEIFDDSKFVRCIKMVVNPLQVHPNQEKYFQKLIDEYDKFRQKNPLIDSIINDLLVGSTSTLSSELYDEYRSMLEEVIKNPNKNEKSPSKNLSSSELRKFRKDQIHQAKNQAAITIQKVARGYQQRQQLKKDQAAITIQKVTRGHQEKTRFQLQQRSAKTIQETYRDYISRKKNKSICNFTKQLPCITF